MVLLYPHLLHLPLSTFVGMSAVQVGTAVPEAVAVFAIGFRVPYCCTFCCLLLLWKDVTATDNPLQQLPKRIPKGQPDSDPPPNGP